MDALRKQLDVLMGANRNGDVREVNRKYYDRDVCRLFLVGLCPHELFQLTKMDMGPCPKVHSLQLRKEYLLSCQGYEEAKAKGTDKYDRELEDVIDKLIGECDRKIGRALKRLEDEDAKAAIAISVSEVTQTPEVLEVSKQIKEKLKEANQHDLEGKADLKIRALEVVEELRTKRADKQSLLLLDAFNKDRASLPQPLLNPPPLASLPSVAPNARTQEMINEKLKKAEDLGEQGMVDEAQKALEEAEALKKLPAGQDPVLDYSKYTAADVRITDQKLRVCDICGAFLSVYDSDRRLSDHFGGKLHLGYMQVREKLAELQCLASALNTSGSIGLVCPGEGGTQLDFLGILFARKRETRGARMIGMMTEDQKREVGNETGNQVGIGNVEIVVTGGGIMIVGAETVTGIMIEIVTEIQIARVLMIQDAAGGRAHDRRNVPGIMIETGAMIDTRNSSPWIMWDC